MQNRKYWTEAHHARAQMHTRGILCLKFIAYSRAMYHVIYQGALYTFQTISSALCYITWPIQTQERVQASPHQQTVRSGLLFMPIHPGE